MCVNVRECVYVFARCVYKRESVLVCVCVFLYVCLCVCMQDVVPVL